MKIAIIGQKQAGKSTMARVLASKLGCEAVDTSTAIYERLAEQQGVSVKTLQRKPKEEIRPQLIELGDRLSVEDPLAIIRPALKDGPLVVAGIRKHDQLATLRAEYPETVVVWINRLGHDPEGPDNLELTERDADLVFENDKTLPKFKKEAEDFLEVIAGSRPFGDQAKANPEPEELSKLDPDPMLTVKAVQINVRRELLGITGYLNELDPVYAYEVNWEAPNQTAVFTVTEKSSGKAVQIRITIEVIEFMQSKLNFTGKSIAEFIIGSIADASLLDGKEITLDGATFFPRQQGSDGPDIPEKQPEAEEAVERVAFLGIKAEQAEWAFRPVRSLIHKSNPYNGVAPAEEPKAFGWNSESEVLARLAAEVPEGGLIVEVGTFLGGSAIWMAQHVRPGVEIVCVDTFLGSIEMWDATSGKYQLLEIAHGRPTLYERFLRNVVRAGVTEHITPFPLDSINAARWFKQLAIRPDLLYIDASHEYEDVKADIKAWRATNPAVIVGDDFADEWPGVKQAVNEAFPKRVVEDRFWQYRPFRR